MSLPTTAKTIITGRDIRPDLHQKTYFKATTSVYIQNSPKVILPEKPKRGKSIPKLFPISTKPPKEDEKREGSQAYDIFRDMPKVEHTQFHGFGDAGKYNLDYPGFIKFWVFDIPFNFSVNYYI